MTRNFDEGWIRVGDALQPVLARLAAQRGMTPEQFRTWCIEKADKAQDARKTAVCGDTAVRRQRA